MSIDPTIVQWGLGLLGTGVLTGLGFILKTLGNQNKALAVLVARVGTSNVSTLEARIVALEGRTVNCEADHSRVSGCEADLSRIWGIYDAWKSAGVVPINTTHH